MRKRILFALIALAVIAAFAAGPLFAAGGKEKPAAGGAKKFKIGYSQCLGKNPFLIAMTNGAKKSMDEWKAKGVEVELIVTDAGDTDMSKQVSDVEDIAAMKVDGLLIFPAAGSKLMSDPIKKLYNAKNIPVVVTDIGLSDAKWASFIITDNYLGGKMLGELAARTLPKGAKVITFDCNPAAENCIARQKGFEETVTKAGLTVLPEKILPLTLEDGRKLTEDTLTAVPDVAAIFHISQLSAQGSVAALKAMGNTKTKVLAFDIDAPSLQMVKDGSILGLAVQDPFNIGYAGMNQMLTYLTGGKTTDAVDIPPLMATKENAASFDDNPQVKQ